jgi:dipeptidyl aminopeptidase/acylaminoacyl peptidase
VRPVFSSYSINFVVFLLQAEERTLWQAQKTYIDMSPYMYADRVKKPILLIHGDEDNNAGTMTMQVHFKTLAILLTLAVLC